MSPASMIFPTRRDRWNGEPERDCAACDDDDERIGWSLSSHISSAAAAAVTLGLVGGGTGG